MVKYFHLGQSAKRMGKKFVYNFEISKCKLFRKKQLLALFWEAGKTFGNKSFSGLHLCFVDRVSGSL